MRGLDYIDVHPSSVWISPPKMRSNIGHDMVAVQGRYEMKK